MGGVHNFDGVRFLMADLRRKNGRDKPWNVKYWEWEMKKPWAAAEI